MNSRKLVPTLALLLAASVVVAAATVSGGCSETTAPGPDLSADLGALRESIDASRDASERLATEVQRQSRRIDDLSRRVAELDTGRPGAPAREPAAERVAADGAEAALPTTDTPSAAIAGEVAAVLASEDGRKVVAAAARGALAERESRQRDAFVAYSLARFADEARLSETQARDVRQAWDDVMADARELIREAAPTADMTPEQRAEKVQEIRAGMQDLGKRREEKMRAILDDEQFALYEKRQDEIDAGLHGAPAGERRPPASGEAPQR